MVPRERLAIIAKPVTEREVSGGVEYLAKGGSDPGGGGGGSHPIMSGQEGSLLCWEWRNPLPGGGGEVGGGGRGRGEGGGGRGEGEQRGLHVGGLDELGLQLRGEQALVDVVQDLVHQLGHDEGLLGERVDGAQLGHQEHPPCTPHTPTLGVNISFGWVIKDYNYSKNDGAGDEHIISCSSHAERLTPGEVMVQEVLRAWL